MAKQRYINTKLWRDSYIENLDPSEKLVFIYLLTNPDTNISGVYEIPLKIVCADTGFNKDMVEKIFARFEKDNKIKYSNGWVAIRNFINHQSINPKVKKGIEDELKNAPKEMLLFIKDSVIKNSLSIDYDRLSDLIKSNSIELNVIKSNEEQKPPRVTFQKPTLDEVTSYCQERQNSVNPDKFINHYESNGWMVGKNKMKDWKACIRTWEGNNYDKPKATDKQSAFITEAQRLYKKYEVKQ